MRPFGGWQQLPWGRSSCSSWLRPHSLLLRHACFQTEKLQLFNNSLCYKLLLICNDSKQFNFNLDMVVGDGAECISCSAPLLRHLVHVRRPPIALQCLVLLARTSSIREGDFRALLTLFLKRLNSVKQNMC